MKVTIDLRKCSPELRKMLATETEDENILEYLSMDEYAEVRAAVVRNRKTDPEILSNLARDHSVSVLIEVAKNSRTKKKDLERIYKHPFFYVKKTEDGKPEVYTLMEN